MESMMERVAGGLGLLDADLVKSAMLDVARDAFVATDQKGRIIEWNLAAEKLFGWSREEILGFFMHDIIMPEEYRERHLAGVARHQETGVAPLFGTRIAMPVVTRTGRATVELTVDAARIRKKWVYVASMRRI